MSEDDYLFGYDVVSKRVVMAGEPIGTLKDESVIAILKKAERMLAPFSPTLVTKLHYCTIDYTVCPKCRGEFRTRYIVNGIEMGYCGSCAIPEYRFGGKVYVVYNNATGARTWHNMLA